MDGWCGNDKSNEPAAHPNKKKVIYKTYIDRNYYESHITRYN